MGACLGKLGINIGLPSADVPEVITEDMLKTIGEALVDALKEFPDTFKWERRKIIWGMWYAGDKGFQNESYSDVTLYWKEFPDNDLKVCDLALKVAAGEALKNVLGEVVHSIVDPPIESKLNEHPYPVRAPARKAADKVIDKAIDEAVDKAVEELRKQIESCPDDILDKVEPTEGEKPSDDNPGLAKMKQKKR